ncbi:MAG: hypothetical protein KBG42_09155 [Lachnospiraceae bacterium]|nr:hypothetical protein [Lachnospiraceae bacterium]
MSLKKAVSKVLALATCFGLVMGSSISVMAAPVTGSSIEVLLRVADPTAEGGYASSGTASVSTTTEGVSFEYDSSASDFYSTSYVNYDAAHDDECFAKLVLASVLTFDGDVAIDIAFSIDGIAYTSSGSVYGFNGDPVLFYDGTASVLSTGSAGESESSSEASSETAGTTASAAPVPAFSNNTVTLADGTKLESAIVGQFVSVEPVALVKPNEARDLVAGAAVPAALPATYRASVSDVKASDSPASTAVLNAFGTATGLDVACALNVNLVDSATTSLATTSAWSAVNNTSGLFAFPAISNGQLSTLYADEASLMVVNLEAGEGANAMIVGVTAGGTAFVQNDLDTNPNTATFLVLPGSGVYGVLS